MIQSETILLSCWLDGLLHRGIWLAPNEAIFPLIELMPRAIQTFEVSLKAFIVRDGRALFVREADSGFWELPGGRIDVGEEWDAHDRILAREIAEELGPEFRVDLTDAVVTWTRRRPTDGVFQFIVGRICRHTGGAPVLSTEHDELAWLGPGDLSGLTFPTESGYATALDALWQRVTASA